MCRSARLSPIVLAAALIVLPSSASAQDVEACSLIGSLVASESYGDALWEIDACKRGVETLWYDGLVAALNVPIQGLEPSGGVVEGAMGINAVTISHGDIESTFTSGAGAAASPMAGLGALASLGASFGVRQEGFEEVRLGRRTTGQLETKADGTYGLMVTLDDGVLMQTGPDKDQLQAVATEMIRILEDYLRN
jgi:hypothetical protein